MKQQQLRANTYRGIKLAEGVKLYNRHGEFSPKVKEGLDKLADLLEQNSHDILSEYKNALTKVLIDRKCGHEPSEITPNNYLKGKDCRKCKDICPIQAKKDLITLVKENAHEWIDGEYKNAKTKVCIDFKCEHDFHWITPQSYKNGQGCPKCAGICPLQAEEDFRTLVKENGHTLLSKYVNDKTKVTIDFGCQHGAYEITPNNYKSGKGCLTCGNNRKNKERSGQAKVEFENLVKENGHEWVEGEYDTTHTKVGIDFKCDHGIYWITPAMYKQGAGCNRCGGIMARKEDVKKAKEHFENLVKENGHQLLSEYEKATIKVLVDFDCKHEPHLITPNDYKNGRRCPYCSESQGEKIIRKWLDQQRIVHMTQYIFPSLPDRKYDFVLPFDNVIVEVHGSQHYQFEKHFHRTLEGFKRKQEVDREKRKFVEDLGYYFIEVDYREHIPQLALERFIDTYNKLKAEPTFA